MPGRPAPLPPLLASVERLRLERLLLQSEGGDPKKSVLFARAVDAWIQQALTVSSRGGGSEPHSPPLC